VPKQKGEEYARKKDYSISCNTEVDRYQKCVQEKMKEKSNHHHRSRSTMRLARCMEKVDENQEDRRRVGTRNMVHTLLLAPPTSYNRHSCPIERP